MKHYVTPQLEAVEWQTQDVVTASLVGIWNTEDGDVVTPSESFWD